MGAPTIVAGLRQMLAPHVPFSQMSEDDLAFLLAHVEVGYFAPGETVLAPSASVASHCFIVKQGQVRGLINGDPERVAFEAAMGDCFPVGALLADRPVSLTYVAVGDTFLLLLPRAHFDDLTRRSPPFLDFCKRRLGSLLDLSRQDLQAAYAAQASAERTMNTPLRELVRGAPVTCLPDTPLAEAFTRMQAAHVGSVLVVQPASDGDQVLGILTRTDLIGRVILPQVPLATPICEVMTPGVLTLDADASAADATLLMAEHSIRHVPVVAGHGPGRRVIGVVSERDLFTLQRLSVRQLTEAIRHAADAESVATVAEDVRRFSHHLVAQGVAAAQLTKLVSHLNDQLTRRLLTLACERFDVDPDSFCWLALGSEGRHEQTIATDQDNGLVYVDGQAPRERLLALAGWVNEGLARAGFPLCKGEIMARNPRWCGTEGQWRELFAGWIDRGDPDALLNASIFFDFRGIFGNLALATRLRSEVVARAQHTERFLKQMSDNALRNRPSGAGVLDTLLGDGLPDEVDLKMNGTVPIVDAARIWSLGAGVHETNTAERLQRLAAAGRLPEEDVKGWVDAFEFLQLMRLRAQHHRSGDLPEQPNRIATRGLSPLDRRILKEAFRQARKVQQRLELDFPG